MDKDAFLPPDAVAATFAGGEPTSRRRSWDDSQDLAAARQTLATLLADILRERLPIVSILQHGLFDEGFHCDFVAPVTATPKDLNLNDLQAELQRRFDHARPSEVAFELLNPRWLVVPGLDANQRAGRFAGRAMATRTLLDRARRGIEDDTIALAIGLLAPKAARRQTRSAPLSATAHESLRRAASMIEREAAILLEEKKLGRAMAEHVATAWANCLGIFPFSIVFEREFKSARFDEPCSIHLASCDGQYARVGWLRGPEGPEGQPELGESKANQAKRSCYFSDPDFRALAWLAIRQRQGWLPTWLTPRKARVIPIGPAHRAAARELAQRLNVAGVACDVDAAARSLSRRIVRAGRSRTRHVLVLGDREIDEGIANWREQPSGVRRQLPIDRFIELILDRVASLENDLTPSHLKGAEP